MMLDKRLFTVPFATAVLTCMACDASTSAARERSGGAEAEVASGTAAASPQRLTAHMCSNDGIDAWLDAYTPGCVGYHVLEPEDIALERSEGRDVPDDGVVLAMEGNGAQLCLAFHSARLRCACGDAEQCTYLEGESGGRAPEVRVRDCASTGADAETGCRCGLASACTALLPELREEGTDFISRFLLIGADVQGDARSRAVVEGLELVFSPPTADDVVQEGRESLHQGR